MNHDESHNYDECFIRKKKESISNLESCNKFMACEKKYEIWRLIGLLVLVLVLVQGVKHALM